MAKAKTYRQKLVAKLDKVFSQYVRLRDARHVGGYCACITCGSLHHWKEIDCGHFIPRARLATRWDEFNCAAQCKRCNYHRHGEHDIFRAELVRIYGRTAIEAMETKSRLGGKHDLIQLDALLQEYKAKNKKLREKKGLA